jgi:hypothetical protein
VSAAYAEPLDDGAHHVARGAHVADVAHREDEIRTDDTRCDGPLGAFRLKTHVRDLRDHVFANPTEHQHVDAVLDFRVGQRATQGTQSVDRERGSFDPAQQRGAIRPVKVGE